MKRTILSLLITGVFASVGTLAIAQDTTTVGDKPITTAGNQPDGNAQVGGSPDTGSSTQQLPKSVKQTKPANADGTAPSSQVGGAPDTESTTQKSAKTATPTNPGSVDANNQPASKAELKAAKDKAQTKYNEAKAKCDKQTGESKLSCVTQAKAMHSAALEPQWEAQGEMNATDGETMNPSGKDINQSDGTTPAADSTGNYPK